MRLKSSLTTETWITIPKFSKYEVSTEGRVRNIKTGRILKPGDNHNGYLYVSLMSDDGVVRSCRVNRLVWFSFRDGDSHLDVNHINLDRHDNRLVNLDLMTRSENVNHSIAQSSNHGRLMRVQIIETGEIFKSASECARAIGGYPSLVSKCARENRTHRGFTFRRL